MSHIPHCVVIGAGPGIGQAVALAFAQEGMNVSLMSRRPERLAEACAEIRKKTGRHASAHRADAGSEASLRSALAHARKELGDVDVLVFNAASNAMGKPTTLTIDSLTEEFRANVGGALASAKEVAAAMCAKRSGTILFTGGGFAYEPAAEYASLSLDKAALRSLAYTLAQELGRDGVHVATVTVYGIVQSGTKFDPHRIAQSFIALHKQPKGHFDTETIYK